MQSHPANPARNCLPGGYTEETVLKAIEVSGYPVQTRVAAALHPEFYVIEEWGYLDGDNSANRTLDVFGNLKIKEQDDPPVSAAMVVLIECKKSSSPYAFFKNVVDRPIVGFPAVAGLKEVSLESPGKQSIPPGNVLLGLDQLDFVRTPPKCSAFNRIVIKGGADPRDADPTQTARRAPKLELSGDDVFNGIVFPLVKAHEHARTAFAWKGSKPLYPTLLMPIGVLDAPMLLMKDSNGGKPELVPWVRVVRHNPVADDRGLIRTRQYGIDLVHVDFFEEYINQHLKPFAEEFGQRSLRMSQVLHYGGTVGDASNWRWDEVKPKAKK